MCDNLTTQVRTIARVTTAVAEGDLTQKVDIPVQGEMATLKHTVNSMVDQLSIFASEVTRVALEVGTMGVLGGNAKVEGVQGVWNELTNNASFLYVSTLRPAHDSLPLTGQPDVRQSHYSSANDSASYHCCSQRRSHPEGRHSSPR
jgi:HAMP domain-containing protein